MLLDKLLKDTGEASLKCAFEFLEQIITENVNDCEVTAKSESGHIHDILKKIVAKSTVVVRVNDIRRVIAVEGSGIVSPIQAYEGHPDSHKRNYDSFFVNLDVTEDSGYELSDKSLVILGVFIKYVLGQLHDYSIDIKYPASVGEKLILSAVMEEVIPESKMSCIAFDSSDVTIIDIKPESEAITEKIEPSGSDNKSAKYRFEKIGQSWELEFENVLKGVKHLAGMDYIKILLQNPNKKISVFELQAMLNPDTRQMEIEPDENSQGALPRTDNKLSSKSVSLKNLNDKLLALAKEREELEDYEFFEQERIDSEVAKIAEEIDRIRYSREGDNNPEIKSNRDKVFNCINKARKNIKEREIREGYEDTPLYNFLKLHIKTGSTPSYTPPIIDPPQWSC